MAEAIDVQVLMQEIRDRIRQSPDTQQTVSPFSYALPAPEMESLKRVNKDLHLKRSLVGRLPPEPPTLRGRAGGLLVKAVRRSLLWFLSRLDAFHSDVVEALDLQFSAIRQNTGAIESLKGRLAAEMKTREDAERTLRAEIAQREATTRALAENVRIVTVLEESNRRIEMALRQMYTEMPGQGNSEAPRNRSTPAQNSLGTRERQWEIGICGTFDVSNYGDLLFPFLAESELKRRLGNVTLRRFSYHSKTPPSWPYEVTSLTELPEMIHRLDGLLIGGGLLVRLDKDVAPEYAPPTQQIHHPTGYWLTPALMALQHDVPLAWNAPGGDGNEVPGWARPLVEAALALSPYVSVRDEPARAALQPLTYRPIAVVPDTAFGLPRLLDFEGAPSPEFTRLAKAHGLEKPYIVFQPNLGFEGLIRVIQNHPERFSKFQFLVLPVSPEFGEHPRSVDVDLPGVIRLSEWPNPLVIAELIGRSEAAIGHSYHFNITALVAGVPVFRRVDLSAGKFAALQQFDTVFVLPPDGETDVEWFLARVGRKPPSPSVLATAAPLADHWDRIAQIFRANHAPTAPALNRFWQSLPGLLENAGPREGAMPPRRARKVINLEAIGNHRLETTPYRWASIDHLFDPDDARGLTDTYPCDHFKLVTGYDGEKGFEYEARSLIGMGARAATFPDDLSEVWRALAADLLGPDYRAAMSALTGYDLTEAPLEANVFHYGPGHSLGAHKDLPDKLVTHVLYFNRAWNRSDGGCLSILRSKNLDDLAAEVLPVIGNSAVLVRSEQSWHAVPRVVSHSAFSRRSVTVTFYRPGSVSTMWPPGEAPALHSYQTADLR